MIEAASANDFEDDPTDYYDAAPRSSVRTPNQRLCLAVLERALEDARIDDHFWHGALIRDDARRWFAEMDRACVFRDCLSFEMVCGVLGLDPAPIRERVLADTATVRHHIRRQ